MFKKTLTAAIALLVSAQIATAETRVVVDNAPTPEQYAEMLGIDIAPEPKAMPKLRMRGIKMHDTSSSLSKLRADVTASATARPVAPVSYDRQPATPVTIAAPVKFQLDSVAIPDSFKLHLDNLAVVLNTPDAQSKVLVITGHTDSQGAETYNLDLSTRRAMQVRQYLSQKGVAPTQLIAVGKGEFDLISGQERNHAINRRVEFRVAG